MASYNTKVARTISAIGFPGGLFDKTKSIDEYKGGAPPPKSDGWGRDKCDNSLSSALFFTAVKQELTKRILNKNVHFLQKK